MSISKIVLLLVLVATFCVGSNGFLYEKKFGINTKKDFCDVVEDIREVIDEWPFKFRPSDTVKTKASKYFINVCILLKLADEKCLECFDDKKCMRKALRKLQFGQGMDIDFNFLVDKRGKIFEQKGWGGFGEKDNIFRLGLLGDSEAMEMNPKMAIAIYALVACGKSRGLISFDFD